MNPLVLLGDHDQPLVQSAHLLVEHFLFPPGPRSHFGKPRVMNEPIPKIVHSYTYIHYSSMGRPYWAGPLPVTGTMLQFLNSELNFKCSFLGN